MGKPKRDPNAPIMIVPKDRVFERSRGCWNCKHFENAELSRKHWAARRPQDELHLMQQGAFDIATGGIAPDDPRLQSINDMERAVHAGQAGMCMKGMCQTDFVHFKYLCEGWTGREGASVATEGRPVDPLPAELKEIAESRAKKKEE
jgi:hypothetical protein